MHTHSHTLLPAYLNDEDTLAGKSARTLILFLTILFALFTQGHTDEQRTHMFEDAHSHAPRTHTHTFTFTHTYTHTHAHRG